MSTRIHTWLQTLALLCLIVTITACSSGNSNSHAGDKSSSENNGNNTTGENNNGSSESQIPSGRTYKISTGDNATRDMIAAMVQAAPGDIIEFGCGYFELESTLQLINNEDITVRGCGMDKTVLSFRNNNAPEGILAVNMHGIWIEDLTVLDTGGNGIEFRGVDHGRISRVRTIWSSGGGRESPDPITADNVFSNNAARLHVACTDPATQDPGVPENEGGDISSPDYTVSPKSGRYGIYPVSSENILIEESESIGASDAGIYVGQTNTAIIRNSRAAFNVFGFEIENVRDGEYDTNIAECNTGGFLIYDLDGNLRQYGDRSTMHGNISRNNNTYNFTSGGFVGDVPPGSGMITLSYDRIDIFDNLFEDNNTAGIIHVSYELFPEGAGRPTEKRIDWYTEGVHVYRNTFRNNGNSLPPPTTDDIQSQEVAHFLPALVGLKNQTACANPLNATTCAAVGGSGYRGAHILWDGLLDVYDGDCDYPLDNNGKPAPQDERGKPQLTNEYTNLNCHYNQYKFDDSENRIVPDWFASCIDDSNVFEEDSLAFANFNGTKGLEVVIAAAVQGDKAASSDGLQAIAGSLDPEAAANFASSFDTKAHKCETEYGTNLPPLPPVIIPPFQRYIEVDPSLTDADIQQLCEDGNAGEVNFTAAAKVNCPTLDQYRLFSDLEDPRSLPNGRGTPYTLNTKLFSDYTVKYRVLFLPEGEKAVYQDAANGGTINGPNATIQFPSGTIIAKTFAVADEGEGTERPIETRLLIKRVNSKGNAYWVGLPYIWTIENGKQIAKLSLTGGSQAISWVTTDVHSGMTHSGSTDTYGIPNSNQCLSCHGREDGEPGAIPIGPKVRFLNNPYKQESSYVSSHPVATSQQNQIVYWCNNGLMEGCPDNLSVDGNGVANVERIPIFNLPGDSGFAANSNEDIEARARAWLEVNCQHCHNVRGYAASTGLYLDSLRNIDGGYGLCKRPTAAGHEGTDGGTRSYDINPRDLDDSILPFRVGPTATTSAARMPPIARSVVDEEGHALIEQWIRDVMGPDNSTYPSCSSN